MDVFHKLRHGFATEPMNFGVGGCKTTDCGVDRECGSKRHTLTVNRQDMLKKCIEFEAVQFRSVGMEIHYIMS